MIFLSLLVFSSAHSACPGGLPPTAVAQMATGAAFLDAAGPLRQRAGAQP